MVKIISTELDCTILHEEKINKLLNEDYELIIPLVVTDNRLYTMLAKLKPILVIE